MLQAGILIIYGAPMCIGFIGFHIWLGYKLVQRRNWTLKGPLRIKRIKGLKLIKLQQ